MELEVYILVRNESTANTVAVPFGKKRSYEEIYDIPELCTMVQFSWAYLYDVTKNATKH